MVELINKDYADFVSLSSNLVSIRMYWLIGILMSFEVGLDRAIGQLTDPLKAIRDEVAVSDLLTPLVHTISLPRQSVKEVVDAERSTLEGQLAHRNEIREQKVRNQPSAYRFLAHREYSRPCFNAFSILLHPLTR